MSIEIIISLLAALGVGGVVGVSLNVVSSNKNKLMNMI